MIFLHGWLHSGRVWKDIAEHFSSAFTTFEVDLPGFGKSSPIQPQNVTMTSYAEYIYHFINEVTNHTQKPVIVADSLSAILCLHILSNHKFKFRHLFLLGCPSDGLPNYIPALSKFIQLNWILRALRGLPDRVLKIFVKDLNVITLWNRSIDANPLIYSIKNVDPQSAHNLLAIMLEPYSPEINYPTSKITLLRGQYDRLAKPKTLEKLSAHLNDAPIIEIPDSGHSVMLENPLKLIECISNHLE
ncbi:alpha/beta fold hydrolase [Rhodohalobacter mucosus]|uniref:AB hydrolase-1 domain-containing protein n=1 Tax=Rhodohalobacter mucosus TaxID=2079485 RepID=A0A316TSN9_9BACT|nr:alpha/beta hydrolase [Rhodohalobacter mucosus]PWN06359.1 hypothetical protein DDZ15_11095 [Rhodohalobacter mucosus]